MDSPVANSEKVAKIMKTGGKKTLLAGLMALCIGSLSILSANTVEGAAAPESTYLGSISTGLHSPARVAVGPDGAIYVTDPRKSKIHVYAAGGAWKRTETVEGSPLGIAVDSTGNIHVGDQVSKSIKVYGPDWRHNRTIGAGDGEPGDISISASTGRVFATDGKNNVLRIYGPDGTLYKTVGGYGTASGKFDFPTGVAVNDAEGEAVVVDQMNKRIQIFDLDGNYKAAVAPASTTRSGAYSSGALTSGQGAFLDGQGRIYAADAFLGTVHVYDRSSGAWLKSIGTFGVGAGQLSVPLDVVIDGYNRLLITSSNTAKVVIYGIDSYTVPPDDRTQDGPGTYALEDVRVESGRIDLTGGDALVGVVITDAEILDMDVASIRLNGTVQVESFAIEGKVLTVRFDKEKVRGALTVTAEGKAEVVITGNLRSGSFAHAQTVEVLQ